MFNRFGEFLSFQFVDYFSIAGEAEFRMVETEKLGRYLANK